jgi:hypothetical protein
MTGRMFYETDGESMDDSEWENVLNRSGFVISAVNREFLKDPEKYRRLQTASSKGKLLYLMVEEGVELPPDLIQGADIRMLERYRRGDKEHIRAITDKIVNTAFFAYENRQ